jgi:dTDP-glucose 4,6-dehydratase
MYPHQEAPVARVQLITGGAGFIGANYVHHVLAQRPDDRVVVFDKLTYAGNLDNLRDVADDPRYAFVHADICDGAAVTAAVAHHGVDTIVNFAAETHVDRSILTPDAFIHTDVVGTYTLLEAARQHGLRYHQVSTDEVYGHVPTGASKETDPLAPRSPYSASKASGDLLVHAYHITFGLVTTITRGSNTIGPYQHPEKALSLFATNALEGLPLPIYGYGLQERDYMWVGDHCAGIAAVLEHGEPGGVYNVGTGQSITNLAMARRVLDTLGEPESLLQHVTDRAGHDRRYALDTARLRALGWAPAHTPEAAITAAARWYAGNRGWWEPIKGDAFRDYYAQNYGHRSVIQPSAG